MDSWGRREGLVYLGDNTKTHRTKMQDWSDKGQVFPKFPRGQCVFSTLNSFLTNVSPPKEWFESDTTPDQRCILCY